MKEVIKVVTFDKVVHDSVMDATKHLDKLYGNLITKHAHALSNLDKYVKISSYLDEHINEFQQIIDIKKDMQNIERISDSED